MLCLLGYEDGYPVFYDIHLSEKRALELLVYLKDGGIFEKDLTKMVVLEVSGIVVPIDSLALGLNVSSNS